MGKIHFNRTSHIAHRTSHTLIFFLFVFFFCFKISPSQLTLEKKADYIYESDVYRNKDGEPYTKLITLKFNQKVVDLPKGQKSFDLDNISNLKGKSVLTELKKKFGEFRIEKVFPSCVWGDTLKINKRTKEIVKIADFSQVYKIRFDNLINMRRVIRFLSKYKIIEYIDPPMIIQLCSTTINDPEFVNGNQWKLPFVEAQKAWDVTKGSQDTRIVISDVFWSYQDSTYHEDLANRVIENTNTYDNITYIGGGHGSTVAGLAASNTNNGIGIAGMDWNAKLIYIPHFDFNNYYTAINDWGADIINCSWHLKTEEDFAHFGTLHGIFQTALDLGVVVVASAGNDQYNMGDLLSIPAATFPASFNYSNGTQVIACTAYGYDGQIFFPPDPNPDNPTGYWNYSPGTDPINDPDNAFVDFCAPGYDIRMYSYDDRNGYWFGRGTSFSAPVVTGIIGLMLAIDNTLTPTQVYDILKETADKIGEFPYDGNGWNQYYGWGGVNAFRAVSRTNGTPDTPSNFNITTEYHGPLRPKLTWNKSTAADVTEYQIDRRINGGSWQTPNWPKISGRMILNLSIWKSLFLVGQIKRLSIA